ncbi:MAG: hypothetical protein IT330_11665 [Anaerolineae bacterium]|nr:hypothetical protein [Anaerolineae bacterium]
MLNLQELFDIINFVLGLPTALLVVAAAAVLVAAQDWRLLLATLMVQTAGLSVLASRVMPAEWATIHIVVVGLIAIMWFLSARTVIKYARPRRSLWRRFAEIGTWARGGWRALRQRPRAAISPSLWFAQGLRPSFRVLVVIIVAVAAYAERFLFVLPGLPSDLSGLIVWVLIMATLGFALSDDPLRVGLALISGLSAFRLFYLALAPSTLAVGLLDGLSILAGLACSYLMVARGATAWPRQGEPP